MTDLEILKVLEELGISDPTFFYLDEQVKLGQVKKLRERIKVGNPISVLKIE